MLNRFNYAFRLHLNRSRAAMGTAAVASPAAGRALHMECSSVCRLGRMHSSPQMSHCTFRSGSWRIQRVNIPARLTFRAKRQRILPPQAARNPLE